MLPACLHAFAQYNSISKLQGSTIVPSLSSKVCNRNVDSYPITSNLHHLNPIRPSNVRQYMILGGGNSLDEFDHDDISSYAKGNDTSKNKEKKNNKRKFPLSIKKPILFLRKLIQSINQNRILIVARFQKLSRAAKIIVTAQLLVLTLLTGSIGRKVYVASASRAGAGGASTTLLGTNLKRQTPVEIPYSTFMDLAEKHKKGSVPGQHPAIELDNVVIGRESISFQIKSDENKMVESMKNKKMVESNDISTKMVVPKYVYTTKPTASQDLIEFLRDNNLPFRAASTKTSNAIAKTLRGAILCVYLLFMLRMYQAMSGGGGGSGNTPGKLASRNRRNKNSKSEPLIKFDDIEGIDKAKYEVMELVDTLRNPRKYAILGARAPKGLLLEGPPGTGKTMLARATATTAGVPLLYCSGSDFVEMFVGRGAARVRKTFARASKISPCIIFIDELDALGKSRDKSGFKIQSNDEAEQTLNQLLACMDGLDSTTGVCVLAATNRREVLDSALLRPGRFDRIVKVTLPDAKGREKILRVHAKKLPGFEEGVGIDEKRLGR